jgi:hypothetical protein
VSLLLGTLFSHVPLIAQSNPQDVTCFPVMISGGHETDPRDHGRPVLLVAGGLGLPPEVFREAFSRVHPVAPGSYPDQERAQQNKGVLLAALAKYGITNQKLDAVSDAYRYKPGSGQLWPNKPATIAAFVKNGDVLSYKVIDGGSGYSSPPKLSVPGVRSAPVSVKLSFGQNLSSNGSISEVTIVR